MRRFGNPYLGYDLPVDGEDKPAVDDIDHIGRIGRQ